MDKKTARWFDAAVWINAAVGMIWMAVGLRDLFAPNLFRFDGRVARTSTVVLDFAAGAVFLFTAYCFHRARPRDLQSKA